jgi:PAS domain S-box-containing protein
MQESTFIEYDALLIKNSGATFWGKNKFLINCEQNLLEGFILDITERKLSRMLLEINEAKYKAVFHNCFVSIFILDINTLSVLDFNNNCSKLFKYSDNEFKSKKIHELNPDKRLLDLLNISDDYTNLDITFDNIIFKDSEGNDIYVELHINNIFYAKKNALCFNLRDITELKKMEEQIKSYEEQLSFDIKQQINNISLKLNEVNLQTTKNIQENNLLLKKFINNDALNREIQYGRY